MSDTLKITYSIDESHYYITDDADRVNRPQSWVPVVRGNVLPFVFWKVKSGRVAEVGRGDPLVEKYAKQDRWTLPGDAGWRELADRILQNTCSSLRDAESSAAYYRVKRDELADAIVKDGDWRRDDAGQFAALIQSKNGHV